MGHDNTKTVHLHGIIWTELTEEQFEKEWGYGWIFFGYEISVKTINYIVKYVTHLPYAQQFLLFCENQMSKS